MKLHFDPPFLPLQTAALAVLVFGAVFALYARWELRQRARRHLLLLVLRGLLMLLLTFILLNPVLQRARKTVRGKAPFLILIDTSRSMTTADGDATPGTPGGRLTRWATAKRAVLENHALFDALSQRYDVRTYGFDSRAVARSPDALRQLTEPNGNRTGIGEAIHQTVSAARPAFPNPDAPLAGALLLVSDGRDNGAGYPIDAARAARALGFSIYTCCVGKEIKGQDLQVVARRSQAFSAPGQTIELTAEIRDTGIPPTSVQVDLLKEGRKVASRTVTVRPGTTEVAFPVTEPHRGFFRYALACSVAPGETDTANNRANVFLSVLDTHARVLFLEGSPSWDSKFLAKTLRDDPTITLDSIYQLTSSRPFALAGSPDRTTLRVPHTVEDFSHYDILVLGKGYEEFFDAKATEALKQWIGERGGNLVFLRGRAEERAATLRELEPVNYTDTQIAETRVRLTEAGQAHPAFAFSTDDNAQTVVQHLPSLISATRVQGEKALAVVLARVQDDPGADATAPPMALLAYQRYGQGKVMAIVGQGMWRWAFLPPELEKYGHVYEEFWTQTVRWLVSDSDFLPGQNVALHTDRTAYSGNDTVTFFGYLRGPRTAALPTIQITQPNGKTTAVAPAKSDGKTADFSATFRPTLAGEYIAIVTLPNSRANTAPASAAFTVYPGQEEDANRSADPALMRQIAAAGGGQALRPDDLLSLPEKLRAMELAATRTEEPLTAWDRHWVIALLLAMLSAEWLLRRRAGLL